MLVHAFLRTFAAGNFVRNASLRKTKDERRKTKDERRKTKNDKRLKVKDLKPE